MHSVSLVVHEHERLVVGQPVATREGPSVPFQESWFELLARFVDHTRSPAFRVGYRSLSVAHHVGYLRVGPLRIEILPKLAPDTDLPWRDLLVHMMNEAAELRLSLATESPLHRRPRDLFELLVARFVDLAERIVRDGLARSYREVEENGTVLRGRLLLPQHLRANAVHQERVYTAYEVWDADNPPNRILRAALDAVARTTTRADLRAHAEELLGAIPEFENRRLRPEDFTTNLDRRTARYREALVLARMILFEERPDLRWGDLEVISLLFDMNHLFEAYIAKQMRRVPGVRVKSQSRLWFWRGDDGARRILKPDLIVESIESGELTVLDTKWKRLHDDRPSDEDLRQLYAYSEYVGAQRSFLVYPTASGRELPRDGRFEKGRAGGTARVDLFAGGRPSAEAVREQLAALVPPVGASARAGAP